MEILEQTLLPFTRSSFPAGFNFMQENEPKHVSNYAKEWMERKCVTWWKTPLKHRMYETLWHELKESIRKKPKTKQVDKALYEPDKT